MDGWPGAEQPLKNFCVISVKGGMEKMERFWCERVTHSSEPTVSPSGTLHILSLNLFLKGLKLGPN